MSAIVIASAMLISTASVGSSSLSASNAQTDDLKITSAAAASPTPDAQTRTATTEGTTQPAQSGSETPQGDIVVSARKRIPGDPLERVNAKSYAAVQAVDRAVIGPAAAVYRKGLPRPVRNGVHNFLYNLHEPVVALNFMLQHNPGKAVETVGRFAVNTTVGAAGVFDMAKRRPFRLPRRSNGFADTMGFYGVKPGAYLFLPLIGPTTVRDFIGGGVDRLVLPLAGPELLSQSAYTIPAGALGTLDRRTEFDDRLQAVRDSGDPYLARRTIYLRLRQAEIDALHRRKGASDSTSSSQGTLTTSTNQRGAL